METPFDLYAYANILNLSVTSDLVFQKTQHRWSYNKNGLGNVE